MVNLLSEFVSFTHNKAAEKSLKMMIFVILSIADNFTSTTKLHTKAMLEELWNHRLHLQKTQWQSLEVEVRKIDRKLEQFLDRPVDTEIGNGY